MDELYFGGRKYISARRTSRITGYAQDYIGQMCRAGTLTCRKVGRNWYVEESALAANAKRYKQDQREQHRSYVHTRLSERERALSEDMNFSPEEGPLYPTPSRAAAEGEKRNPSKWPVPAHIGEDEEGREHEERVHTSHSTAFHDEAHLEETIYPPASDAGTVDTKGGGRDSGAPAERESVAIHGYEEDEEVPTSAHILRIPSEEGDAPFDGAEGQGASEERAAHSTETVGIQDVLLKTEGKRGGRGGWCPNILVGCGIGVVAGLAAFGVEEAIHYSVEEEFTSVSTDIRLLSLGIPWLQ